MLKLTSSRKMRPQNPEGRTYHEQSVQLDHKIFEFAYLLEMMEA